MKATQRPRWCQRCRELRPWQKVRLLGARASYRACATCGGRTNPRMPGRKKRVPRPGSWRLLMKDCDDLARARAHARGACEKCGRTKADARMEWAHGMGRAYHAVRHLDENGRLLCYRCHTFFTNHWPEWQEFLIGKMGAERFAYIWEHRNDRCGAEALARTLAVLRAGEPCTEVST